MVCVKGCGSYIDGRLDSFVVGDVGVERCDVNSDKDGVV